MVVSGNTFKLPSLTQFMADRLGYAIITLNRPTARNAVNGDVANGLEAAIDRLEADGLSDSTIVIWTTDHGDGNRVVRQFSSGCSSRSVGLGAAGMGQAGIRDRAQFTAWDSRLADLSTQVHQGLIHFARWSLRDGQQAPDLTVEQRC